MPRLKPKTGARPALKSKPPPSEGRRFGYACVSTYGQTLDAQLEQLKAEGCTKVYREKASGAQPSTPIFHPAGPASGTQTPKRLGTG
jgi:hypothetical protein